MLARYRIVRGTRAQSEPLPRGERQDTRKHTRHILRPEAEMVTTFLTDPTARGFRTFRSRYLALLATRFEEDSKPFDDIAELCQRKDVYLGCNCPTNKQPDVNRCHTVLALEFFAKKYPHLDVVLPGEEDHGF